MEFNNYFAEIGKKIADNLEPNDEDLSEKYIVSNYFLLLPTDVSINANKN